MREYEAEKARIDANTTRLRGLRLAKEAADAAKATEARALAPAQKAAAKPAAKPLAKAPAKTGASKARG